MSFQFHWPQFDGEFIVRAMEQLEVALNKGEKPPHICDTIRVRQLNLGTMAPDLEMVEISDLSLDKFKGIFRLNYCGDAHLLLQTKVQVNPVTPSPRSKPSRRLSILDPVQPSMVSAHKPLEVPMLLRLSQLRVRALLTLAIDARHGVTLSFKNDPLESVLVNSTFDDVPSVRQMLQSEIERTISVLLADQLPGIIHQMSLVYMNLTEETIEETLNYRARNNHHVKNIGIERSVLSASHVTSSLPSLLVEEAIPKSLGSSSVDSGLGVSQPLSAEFPARPGLDRDASIDDSAEEWKQLSGARRASLQSTGGRTMGLPSHRPMLPVASPWLSNPSVRPLSSSFGSLPSLSSPASPVSAGEDREQGPRLSATAANRPRISLDSLSVLTAPARAETLFHSNDASTNLYMPALRSSASKRRSGSAVGDLTSSSATTYHASLTPSGLAELSRPSSRRPSHSSDRVVRNRLHEWAMDQLHSATTVDQSSSISSSPVSLSDGSAADHRHVWEVLAASPVRQTPRSPLSEPMESTSRRRSSRYIVHRWTPSSGPPIQELDWHRDSGHDREP